MTAPKLAAQIQGMSSVSADNLNTYYQTCDTIPQLRDFIGLPGIQVFVRGTVQPNDGGGGVFYWNAVGVGPDDNVNTIVPIGAATGVWSRLLNAGSVAQAQVLVAGAGNFLTPPSTRQLRVRMIGGGGGGSGAGNSGVGDGSDGQPTVFGGVGANGGGGGAHGGRPGQGGFNGAGAALFRLPGKPGNWPIIFAAFPNYWELGGMGGGNGTRVAAYPALTGLSALPNSGGGGNGGTFNAGPTFFDLFNSTWGFGGAEGEYVEFLINSPAASIPYSVGNGGVGGPGGGTGGPGGNGGSGYIIVEAFF